MKKRRRRRRKVGEEKKVDFNQEYPPLPGQSTIVPPRPLLTYSSTVTKNITSLKPPLPKPVLLPVTLEDFVKAGEEEMKSWLQ